MEVLQLGLLDPPNLFWNATENGLSVPGDWTGHQWFLNGTLLDAEGATLEAPAAGNYTLTAVDPSTGCTVSTSGAVGCPGDLDADQVVGVSDVLLLLGGFGCSGDCGVSDVNADGVVNVTDVLFLLGLFGSIC